MLDKLNKIASMVADAIASSPPSAKKKKLANAEPEHDDGMEHDEFAEDRAEKTQKAVRKNLGGEKEPY